MEGAGGWVPAAAAAADGKKGIIRCSKKNYYVMDENGVCLFVCVCLSVCVCVFKK